MKRKIISLLLCASMSVTLLAACGTKDVDATNDKVASNSSIEEDDDKSADSAPKDNETVNVTKRLEKQYIESIEAYQEYYEKESDDYEYELYARVTVNKDGLPLLWLCYSVDESPDNTECTQLLSYDSGEVAVLAEIKNVCGCPYISDEVVAAKEFGENNIYVYDSDNALFKKIELSDDYDEAIENEVMHVPYSIYYYWINHEKQEISYIGKRNDPNNYYYEETTQEGPSSRGASVAVGENEVVQIEIPYVDRKIVEIEDDNKFYYADGLEGSCEQAKEELGILDDYEVEGNTGSGGGCVEWLSDFDVDTMFRALKNQPVYSSEELFMLLVSNSLFFEHSDGTVYSIGEPINLKEYNFAKASDDRKLELISDYVYDGEFDPRYMEESLYEQLESEPYVTFRGRCYISGYDWSWDVDEEQYSDNIAAFTMDDGTVCKFQIEFNGAGDKISKITYISQ